MSETKKAHEQDWTWNDGARPGLRQGLRKVFDEAKDTTADDIALAEQAPRMARLLFGMLERAKGTDLRFTMPGLEDKAREILKLARVLPPK